MDERFAYLLVLMLCVIMVASVFCAVSHSEEWRKNRPRPKGTGYKPEFLPKLDNPPKAGSQIQPAKSFDSVGTFILSQSRTYMINHKDVQSFSIRQVRIGGEWALFAYAAKDARATLGVFETSEQATSEFVALFLAIAEGQRTYCVRESGSQNTNEASN